MRRAIAVCTLFLVVGCDQHGTYTDADDVASDIKSDEAVIFFRTSGWLDDASQEWHLPVHGWIYEPEYSLARMALFEKVLNDEFALSVTKKTESNFLRRVNLLLADNERGKKLVVSIADSDVELPESAENGHFEKTVVISAADAAKYAKNGLMHYTARTGDTEPREFTGVVKLAEANGLSVISDIDDTVKVSNVGDRRSLLEHTFLLDFVAAPGMAERYREWSAQRADFHFVSSSPWQLYEPLSEFLDRNGFPWATLSLKSVRFRDETVLDLFKKGTETKPPAIEKILNRYPARKFVLIGDSGEKDPEVYATLLRNRPGQILKIYIRNVTQENSDNERFTTVFKSIDRERWQLFDDPRALTLPNWGAGRGVRPKNMLQGQSD